MADTSVVDLDAHFVGPRRSNLDVLDGQGLAGSPSDGGLLQLSLSVPLLPPLETRQGPFLPRLAVVSMGNHYAYFAGNGLLLSATVQGKRHNDNPNVCSQVHGTRNLILTFPAVLAMVTLY